MVTDCYSQFSPWTCAKWLQDSKKRRRLLPVLKCIEEPKRSKESWESKRPKESSWESFEGSGVCPRREDASGEENATQSSLRLCQCQFFSSPPSISKNSNFGKKKGQGSVGSGQEGSVKAIYICQLFSSPPSCIRSIPILRTGKVWIGSSPVRYGPF